MSGPTSGLVQALIAQPEPHALLFQLTRFIVMTERLGGERLTESALAKRFNVSRTPLREALRQLETIGVIRRRQNRTLEIPPLSIAEMTALSETRERLEGLAAYHVINRYKQGEITLDSIERINSRMEALAKLKDVDLLLDLGIQFHVEIWRLSGNAFATQMLEQTLLCMERYRLLVRRVPQRGREVVREHRELLDVLRERNPDAGELAMRAHIRSARQFYEKVLRQMLASDQSVSAPEPIARSS